MGLSKLVSLVTSAGEVKKKKPRFLIGAGYAVVDVSSFHPICVELYADCRPLGRFLLRSSGTTVAAGIITAIRD